MPTFAIERAQELLYHLATAIEAGLMPPVLVFLDSPMAIDALEVFRRHPDYWDARTREAFASGALERRLALAAAHPLDRRVEGDQPHPGHVRDPRRLRDGARAGGSSTTSPRTSRGHESTVLFVGHQAHGTLGRTILDGAREVRIFRETHPVRAAVRQIQGLSAHADQDDLLRWLAGLGAPPRRLWLNHGEPEASRALAAAVRERFGWEAEVPAYGSVAELV